MPPRKKLPQSKSPPRESRVSIIQAVQTPLGFFTLGLLISESVLLAATALAPDQNRTTLIWGCLALILVSILIVGVLAFTRADYLFGRNISSVRIPQSAEQPLALGDVSTPEADARVVFKYDVFLSSPMAALPPGEEYESNRKFVLKFIEALRTQCDFKNIFYAGRHIESTIDFDPADISVKDDLEAIHASRYFLMIYPAKIVSSVLVEAGWAIALRKPSIYFVNSHDHLPFLLQEAVQAFKHVKLYKFQQLDDIAAMIAKHRLKLFEEKS